MEDYQILVQKKVDCRIIPLGGYSGAKNSPLEGGHRVPFIAVWPQKIKPNTVSHELVVNTDLLATFASLVNRPLSDEDVVDSNNLIPLLLIQ